ncbi:hypothetical protein GGI00_000506 [Coemansia sp. RSA 2681]|nr:hypothetical protein GGI00_000506 [Coemansia sp. RSA 2681]
MADSGAKRPRTGNSKRRKIEKRLKKSSSSANSHSPPATDAGQAPQCAKSGAEHPQAAAPRTPSPSSRPVKMPSELTNSSSTSRVHGERLIVGPSDWPGLASDGAILVDKSLAIKRVMSSGAVAMVAIAPRRSGKSTFLSMMAEFLSAHSSRPVPDRAELVKEYSLFKDDPEFFKRNFAKYPVLFFDLSDHIPSTVAEAVCCLQKAAHDSSIKCMEYLEECLAKSSKDGDFGGYNSFDEMEEITKILTERHKELSGSKPVALIKIAFFLRWLMEAMYMAPGGRSTVVIIDEYDKPLAHVLCEQDINAEVRRGVIDTYTSFYSSLLKGNYRLKLGLMAGVFNIPLTTAGSGPSNVRLYQAHTGAWDGSKDANPFDTAFNFTAADVKGLVDKHVSIYASANDDAATRKQLSTNLMLYCFERFGGYHYGSQGFVSNTYGLVKFLSEINCRKSLTRLPRRKTPHWTGTGNMAMFRQMRAADVGLFTKYASALTREFKLRHAYHYGAILHNGVLLGALRKVDMDAAIGALDDIQGTEFQVGVDAEELDTVAEMCIRRPHSDMELDWSSTDRPVASVYRSSMKLGI